MSSWRPTNAVLLWIATAIVTFLITIICATCADASPEIDFTRAVYIDKEIDQGISSLGEKLLDYTAPFISEKDALGKISTVPNERATDPVSIIIDSPGGETVNGFWFIDVMREVKSRGVTIKCYVPHIAASMAFQIFLHCDEHYALPQSILLWHRVRAMFMFFIATGPKVAEIAEDLASWDKAIMRDLRALLPLSEEVIVHHYERETAHIAFQLSEITPRGWLRVYDAIPNLLTVPDSVPRLPTSRGLFDMAGQQPAVTPGQQQGAQPPRKPYRIIYQYRSK